MNQKIEFGHRLHEGMRAVGLEPKPSVLLNLFNARYWGTSVSFQAVSRWLNGQAMPRQDKLVVLAEILRMEPELLQYGRAVHRRVQDQRKRWDEALSYQEREMFDAYLQLPVPQRKVVREVIEAFAIVHKHAPRPAGTKPKG
jgi:transcriptional regulator with XRE-family HTH domain